MYYLNGGIDYSEIVTSRSSPLAPTSEHASFLTPTQTNITLWINCSIVRREKVVFLFIFHLSLLPFLISDFLTCAII